MSLFDQLLGAVSNPQQQASPDQLGQILGVAQQLAGNHGIDNNASQAVMSVLGGHVRSALQNQQGGDPLSMVNQFAGLASNPNAVNALFPGGQQEQVAQDISQRTGINSGVILAMLPVLIPLVLNLLQGGNTTQQSGAQSGGNPLLNAFLDSNQDGNFDLGDAMGLASQFLNR